MYSWINVQESCTSEKSWRKSQKRVLLKLEELYNETKTWQHQSTVGMWLWCGFQLWRSYYNIICVNQMLIKWFSQVYRGLFLWIMWFSLSLVRSSYVLVVQMIQRSTYQKLLCTCRTCDSVVHLPAIIMYLEIKCFSLSLVRLPSIWSFDSAIQ